MGYVVVTSLACLCGLALYAFYAGCDLLELNRVQKSDQVRSADNLFCFKNFHLDLVCEFTWKGLCSYCWRGSDTHIPA